MASQIWRDCKLFMGAYDLSGDMNAHALEYKADILEATVFGDTAKRRTGGLMGVTSKHEGLWTGGAGAVDDALFASIAAANQPLTVCPLTGAEGELAYFFNAKMAQYSPGGKIGELLRFSVNSEGGDGSDLIRGSVALNGTKTATGNGTIYNLGAVGATQKLYAALHVTSASGGTPSLTCAVQSAATGGFGSPTTRITFGAKTAIGSEMAAPVAGAITDAYWRATWTISGSTPSFRAVLLIGIK